MPPLAALGEWCALETPSPSVRTTRRRRRVVARSGVVPPTLTHDRGHLPTCPEEAGDFTWRFLLHDQQHLVCSW